MNRITHRDHDAVFITMKTNWGWTVTVTGYTEDSSSVTDKWYCKNISEVTEIMNNFYAIPILQRN